MDSIWLNYRWTISWMRGWGQCGSQHVIFLFHLYSEYAYPGYLKPQAPIWRAIVRSYYLRHLCFYDIFSILASAPKWNDLCIESQTNLFGANPAFSGGVLCVFSWHCFLWGLPTHEIGGTPYLSMNSPSPITTATILFPNKISFSGTGGWALQRIFSEETQFNSQYHSSYLSSNPHLGTY